MSNTKTNTEWSSREVGAFWKNKGRTTGQTYLSGHIAMEDEETGAKRRIKLVVFPNKFKEENEKAPDFHVYLSKDKEEEGEASQQAPKVAEPELAEDLI
jgi:uncharacterized protein (DUF736 family)